MVMHWTRDIQKLGLIFVGVFLVSACLVVFFLYLSYQKHAFVEVKAALDSDIRGLSEVYRFTGRLDTVQQAIEQRLGEANLSTF